MGNGPGPDWHVGTAFSRACVFIDGSETWYERGGAGRPLLLLAMDPAVRSALAISLARSARVILPDSMPPAPGGPAWIRGLLEGLGIENAGIVADESWALSALSLMLADPWRSDRLLILLHPGSPLLPDAGLEDRFDQTGQHVLLLEIPAHPVAAAVGCDMAFAAGAAADAWPDAVLLERVSAFFGD